MAQTVVAVRQKKPRFFYGWYVVLASFLAHIAYAEQHSSILGVFFRPMTAEFGWSRTALSGVQSSARLVEGAIAPFIGPILDRHGARGLMVAGGLIAGFALLGLSQVQSLWQYYFFKGFLAAIGFLLMGFIATNVAVANWFVRLRGRALGIAGMGTPLASMLVPPITVWVINGWGWRPAWMVFAVLTWAVVVIPAWLWMRRRPEDMGLLPDGDDPETAHRSSLREGPETVEQRQEERHMEPVWTWQEILRTRAFWLLIFTLSVANLAFQGINISLFPYLEDLGYASSVAAMALSARAFFGLVGNPLWGFAADRIDIRYLGSLKFAIQAVVALMLLVGRNLPVIFTAVMAYGIGAAGSEVITGVIWANFYGRLSLGTVRSVGMPFTFIFSAAGPVFMNWIFDYFGSYHPAFALFIGLFLCSAVLFLFCRPPKANRYVEVSEAELRQASSGGRGHGGGG
jgi:MFS family permease